MRQLYLKSCRSGFEKLQWHLELETSPRMLSMGEASLSSQEVLSSNLKAGGGKKEKSQLQDANIERFQSPRSFLEGFLCLQ